MVISWGCCRNGDDLQYSVTLYYALELFSFDMMCVFTEYAYCFYYLHLIVLCVQ